MERGKPVPRMGARLQEDLRITTAGVTSSQRKCYEKLEDFINTHRAGRKYGGNKKAWYLTENSKRYLPRQAEGQEKGICTSRRHQTLALRERNDGLNIERPCVPMIKDLEREALALREAVEEQQE
ncbi:hypothetical protein FPCIR_11586 [Fusarium pseudocircinatum]|uniref:Uncharacterized protein n=1 Tax=Fusarium pseudocircinatum TaxID=56676 RepID=A0A8H5KTJ5_9HYPO|nr:hypothetical protein FPCIR_11586 [Fusarium pseudocircinatum]